MIATSLFSVRGGGVSGVRRHSSIVRVAIDSIGIVPKAGLRCRSSADR